MVMKAEPSRRLPPGTGWVFHGKHGDFMGFKWDFMGFLCDLYVNYHVETKRGWLENTISIDALVEL